jgi:hypothetical protein
LGLAQKIDTLFCGEKLPILLGHVVLPLPLLENHHRDRVLLHESLDATNLDHKHIKTPEAKKDRNNNGRTHHRVSLKVGT